MCTSSTAWPHPYLGFLERIRILRDYLLGGMLQILAASLTGILQKDDNLLSLRDSGRFGILLTCLGVSGRTGFGSWQPLYLKHPGRGWHTSYLLGSLWKDGI